MKDHYLKFCVILLLMFVGACTQNPNPQGKPLPHLSYSHLEPYQVRGGGVTVRRSFASQLDHMDHQVGAKLSAVLLHYVGERFDTQGYPVNMVFDIAKVEVRKTSYQDKGAFGLWSAHQDVYKAHILVFLNLLDQKSIPIEIKKTLAISDQLSLAERDVEIFEFIEGIILDLDRGIAQVMELYQG